MFTGIIEAVGKIAAKQMRSGDMQLTIDAQGLDFSDIKLGDSIATNGVCLTVTALNGKQFVADVSNETLRYSTLKNIAIGDAVNLEKAMLATGRFGGHIVSGHVDGVASVKHIEQDARSVRIELLVEDSLQHYLAHKGSITVDGVSLTVNALTNSGCILNIVPHTAQETIIAQYKAGQQVNIEVDVVARYLERLLQKDDKKPLDREFLAQHGFLSRKS